MILRTQTARKALPSVSWPMVKAMRRRMPWELAGVTRRSEFVWKGERLFGHCDWVSEPQGAVAFIRFQWLPEEDCLWLGALEVHPEFRGQGIGSEVVRSMEGAAWEENVGLIRLFSRQRSKGFWLRLGYEREQDPRYLRKTSQA